MMIRDLSLTCDACGYNDAMDAARSALDGTSGTTSQAES